MLFEEYQYFNYQFPEPQYLGAKHTLLPWINQFIPKSTKTAIDAFAGSQSVAFLFKQMGFTTFSNDFLNFNNQIFNQLEEIWFDDLDVVNWLAIHNKFHPIDRSDKIDSSKPYPTCQLTVL